MPNEKEKTSSSNGAWTFRFRDSALVLAILVPLLSLAGQWHLMGADIKQNRKDIEGNERANSESHSGHEEGLKTVTDTVTKLLVEQTRITEKLKGVAKEAERCSRFIERNQ